MIVRALISVIALLGVGLAVVMAGPVHAQSPDAQSPDEGNPDVGILVDAASGLY